MINYKTILKQVVSFVLMCVFAFSITPVIILHNLFADHSDQVVKHNHTKSSEVAKAGIDCHINNFVAERNFVASCSRTDLAKLNNFPVFSAAYNPAFYSQHHFYAELRGPPVRS